MLKVGWAGCGQWWGVEARDCWVWADDPAGAPVAKGSGPPAAGNTALTAVLYTARTVVRRAERSASVVGC